MAEKTDFPVVAETALWTAIARMEDARSKKPLCNDTFAARFADAPRTAVVADLLRVKRPTESVVVRHAFIDDVVRKDASRVVVILGAGLDTRAFRLGGGTDKRFVEVDHPELVAWKEARLPAAEAPTSLERVGVDFAKETLRARLAHLATDEHTLVLAEGLLMYLTEAEASATLETMRALFPSHTFVADILSANFTKRFSAGLMPVLAKHGMTFRHTPESPTGWFEAKGYRVDATSTVEIMQRAKGVTVPRLVRFLFKSYFRDLYTGNVVVRADTRSA